jgi:hypothetical protein
MTFPSKDGPNSYVWKLKDVYNARLGDNWPDYVIYSSGMVYQGGGTGAPGPAPLTADIISFSLENTGTESDFGDLTLARLAGAGTGSTTRGIFGGGRLSPTDYNIIDFITFTSKGNATDFGDLTNNRRTLNIGQINSTTRGIFAGGYLEPSGWNNTIDYVTMATAGNASDFGDLTEKRAFPGGLSSPTRGVTAGGSTEPAGQLGNVINYITIAYRFR